MSERPVAMSEGEWRERLTPAQYEVLRRAGTERPFTGDYLYNKDDGMYLCGACGAPLFSSESKFDSHSGWPSFTEPALAAAVELRPDNSLLMRRTEVVCRRCGGHLGHVFDDGPGPTGERYCINSAALGFTPSGESGAQGEGQPGFTPGGESRAQGEGEPGFTPGGESRAQGEGEPASTGQPGERGTGAPPTSTS